MKNISVVLLNAFPEKKIKTLGNKGLIEIKKNNRLIDYHIDYFSSFASNIIIVDGYDNKKMQKYLETKGYLNNKKIKYISHEIDDGSNIGTSIKYALKYIVNTHGLLIHNTSIILNKKIITKLHSMKNNFCIVQKNKSKNDIGCLTKDSQIITCFYGLPIKLLDTLYIDKKNITKFLDMIKNTDKISNMFLFEIINTAIEIGIFIEAMEVNDASVKHITSSKIYNLRNVDV